MGLLSFLNKKSNVTSSSSDLPDFTHSSSLADLPDLPPISDPSGSITPNMNMLPNVNTSPNMAGLSNPNFSSSNNFGSTNLSAISTDLPSIEGGLLDLPEEVSPFDKLSRSAPLSANSNTIASNAINSTPSVSNLSDKQVVAKSAQNVAESKSISINIPTLDFSMPPADDEPAIEEPQKPAVNVQETAPSLDGNSYLDVEDLNKLFLSDDWHEPDWNTFDPYVEDKIDEPKAEDFPELPEFDKKEIPPAQEIKVVDIVESHERNPQMIPMELFIRGKEYNKVFIELDAMSKSLSKIDTKISEYLELTKREEPLLSESKTQMEYLYHRVTLIDKKIFNA